MDRERLKLHKYLCGVKDMTRLPGAIFIVDLKREAIAVREADRLGIPVIAIADTNANPDLVEYPVPGNDDAIRSVGLITRAIAESVREASAQVPEEQKRKVQDAQATTYSTETGEVTETPSRPAAPRRKRVPRPEVLEKLAGAIEAKAAAAAVKQSAEKPSDEPVGAEAGAAASEATSDAEATVEGEETADTEVTAEAGVTADAEAEAAGDAGEAESES